MLKGLGVILAILGAITAGLGVIILISGSLIALLAWGVMLLWGALANGLGYPEYAFGFKIIFPAIALLVILPAIFLRGHNTN